MKIIRNICRAVFTLLEYAAMTVMVFMVIIVFVQVVLRYVFSIGIRWAEEVTNLCMAWFGFIGIAIDVIEKRHISIEAITNWLPKKALDLLIRFGYVLIAAFGVSMVYGGLTIMKATSYATLPTTKWPASVSYLVLVVGGVLIVLNAILVVIKKEYIITGENNTEDISSID